MLLECHLNEAFPKSYNSPTGNECVDVIYRAERYYID